MWADYKQECMYCPAKSTQYGIKNFGKLSSCLTDRKKLQCQTDYQIKSNSLRKVRLKYLWYFSIGKPEVGFSRHARAKNWWNENFPS